MLGFKVEVAPRETAVTNKARPIYLDMQVSVPLLRMAPFLNRPLTGYDSYGSSSLGFDASLLYRSIWESA
jgi:hypothetical protein